MAASDVEICNSALHKIGAKRITSLSDSTPVAEACNDLYNRLRKQLLRSHPWNFAIAYVSLAATANTPVWDDWSTEFTLPSDVLRILATNLPKDAEWEKGYNADGTLVIFCNDSSLKIKYIKDVTNTTRFDAVFDEAFSWLMAANLAYKVTNSLTLQQQMFRGYQEFVRNAMSFDGQEHGFERVMADELIDIRG